MKHPVYETNFQSTYSRPWPLEGRREHHTGLQSYRYPSMVSPYTHKGVFRDTIKLRYGWQLPHLPSYCTCRKKFTVEHAFNCSCARFPSLRHNDIRDIIADFLTEVSPSVLVKPTLSHSQVNNSGARQRTQRIMDVLTSVHKASGGQPHSST